MTIHASAFLKMIKVSWQDTAKKLHPCGMPMATDTVLLDCFSSGFTDINGIWFITKGKNGGMPESVLRFKKVFMKEIIMGNMAIIANGNIPVGTVRPVAELRIHYMAVDAGFRIVR